MRKFFCLIGLAACVPSPKPVDLSPSSAVILSAEIDPQSSLLEGDLASLKIRIQSIPGRYVLLRELALRGEASAVIRWQIPLEGHISYDPSPDEYRFDRHLPEPTMPIFNTGFLASSEDIVVHLRVRLLGLPKELILSYTPFTGEQVSDHIYFERPEEKVFRYKRCSGKDLEKALMTRTNVGPDITTIRRIIFPHAESPLLELNTASLILDLPIRKRSFTLQEARKKSQITAVEAVTYASSFRSWILRGGGKTVLVNPNEVRELPIIDLQAFLYLDQLADHEKLEIEFLKETGILFADEYRLISTERSGRIRTLLFLTKGGFLLFLDRIRAFRLRVDVQLTKMEGRLIVTR